MGYDSSLNIKGVCEPDEQFKKMKEAWDTCKTAGVEIPEEIANEYFNYNPPPEEGMLIDIETTVGHNGDRFMVDGVRSGPKGNYRLVDLSKVPKRVTHLMVWIQESY